MRTAIRTLVGVEPPNGNWGLAYQAYVTGFRNKDDTDRDRRGPDPQDLLFQAIAKQSWPQAYKDLFWPEWTRGLASTGAQVLDAKTTSPFALGLGEQTVHEVGLTLHRTYGVPYVPGSSVKGAMRRALAEWMGIREVLADTYEIKKDKQGNEVRVERYQPDAKLPELLDRLDLEGADDAKFIQWARIFGTTGEAGLVEFLDAMPDPGASIAQPMMPDTVTVHHPDYYQGKAELPSDMDDPTPVGFLAVKPGVVFKFAFIVPKGREKWADALKKVLLWHLEREGLGAKTNAGYGRFAENTGKGPQPPGTGAQQSATSGQPYRAKVVRKQGKDLLVRGPDGEKMCMAPPQEALDKVQSGDTIIVEPTGRTVRYVGIPD